MSIESAKKFKERLRNDKEWQEKVTAAKDKDARLEMVKAEGFDFTLAELDSVSGILDDKDLEDVSGGYEGFQCC